MGLISCPDCEKEVSDSAAACIHCGRPLSADLTDKPAAGSAQAAKMGRQRSKFRNDLGNAVGAIGFVLGLVVGVMAGNLLLGLGLAVAGILFGIWIAYGS